MKKSVFLIVLGVGVSALLAGPDEKQPAPAAVTVKPSTNSSPVVAKSVADYPVIGYIEKQGKVITIKAGPKGTLYSLKTTDGKVLSENLSAEQLRAQAPELHDFLKKAVVIGTGDARVRAPKIDASMGIR